MDKLAIVIDNYIGVECDANTTPRQAYERGFRRATEKWEVVMRSRKVENDQLKDDNASLRELAWELYVIAYPMTVDPEDRSHVQEKYVPCERCRQLHNSSERPCVHMDKNPYETLCRPIQGSLFADKMRELGVEMDVEKP